MAEMIHPCMVRNPVSPLPYKRLTEAQPNELIIDYDNGSLYYINDSGDLIDITLGLINRLPASSISFVINDQRLPLQNVITDMLNKDKSLEGDISDLSRNKQNTITGAASSITNSDLTELRVLISNKYGKIEVSNIDVSKLNLLSNITKDVQTQINELSTSKQNNITGAATTIASSNLDKQKVIISNDSGKIAVSNITTIELNALSGIKGNIQSQFDLIPKFNYLKSISANTIPDSIENNQAEIDKICIAKIKTAYPSPTLWDATNVSFTFETSDILKNALYYFNGTNWIFQYYTTTGVQRANGTIAGIVENSNDITFVDGKGTIVADIIRYNVDDSGSTAKNLWTADKLIKEFAKKQNNVTGAATTVLSNNLSTEIVVISDKNGKIASSIITKSELEKLSGIKDNIQKQIDAKINKAGNAPSRALITDAAGNIIESATSSTELSYLKGLKSNLQSQLDSKFESVDNIMDNAIGNIMLMNNPKHSGACTGDNSGSISIGGTNASGILNITEIFNSITWNIGPNMNSARTATAASGDKSSTVAIGGTINTSVSETCEKFNGTVWSATASMNNRRTRMAACGYSNNTLVAGYNAFCEKFNGTTWSTTGNLLTNRYDLALAGTGSAAIVMAGTVVVTGAILDTSEIFNGSAWVASAKMLYARSCLAGFGEQNAALAVCGNTSTPTNVSEFFNGISWNASSGTSYAREKCEGSGFSVLNGIITAGINGSNYIQYTEAFNGIGFRHKIGDNIYDILASKFDKAGGKISGDIQANIISANKVYSAVWNDYAEYRQSLSDYKPGTVVVSSTRNDEIEYLMISTKRLQPNAKIITDTFGFSLGKKNSEVEGEFSLPIALAGRVLAYTDKDRSTFHKGDVVCAGPNGTVSKMNRLEIILFPDRIIGVVSSIPSYDEWEGIIVDNRIWIDIK